MKKTSISPSPKNSRRPEADVLILRHVPHEGPGLIADALRSSGRSFRLFDVWKRNARFPRPETFKALVIMGGPMGVYEKKEHPFLVEEIKFLRAFLRLGRPALGVCLGSQLIAAALGARVYKNKHREVGWYPVDFTREGRRDPLAKAFGLRATLLQWHGDTFTLPRGATHLASSPLCRQQAFRSRDNVYALQFHPEVTPAMFREWLAHPDAEPYARGAGPRAWERLKMGAHHRWPAMHHRARKFFDGWTRLIE